MSSDHGDQFGENVTTTAPPSQAKPGILRSNVGRRDSTAASMAAAAAAAGQGQRRASCEPAEAADTRYATSAMSSHTVYPLHAETATISSLPSVKWAVPTAEGVDDSYTHPRSATAARIKSLRPSAQAVWPPTAVTRPLGYRDEAHDEIVVLSGNAASGALAPLCLPDYSDGNHSEDEDYSISVSAVMQRRASTKPGHHRRKVGYQSPRRTSSPMMGPTLMLNAAPAAASAATVTGADSRRRSSVFTTSSGDAAQSYAEGGNTATITHHHDSTKEQIFENIRLHKEVLQSVKLQPWSMRRKLRLVRQAKEYVARHEGALQERFAMSRSTKDLWARFKIMLAARWQHSKREVTNLSTVLIPWELRIKEIESHFGSVVASYFTFLRWLFWVNIVIALALTVFVVVPEFLGSTLSPRLDDLRKHMLPAEIANATRLISIWDFEGFLKYSPLFYGYYSNYSGAIRFKYDLPLAYFLTGLAVYIYSFWATLRKMAENSRTSKLSSKDDECVFSWKLFTGWDFMIGHAETAHNRIASVVLGFKEALLEEAEKKKDKRNWKIIVLRCIVNLLVLHLLAVSAFAVVTVVNRSTQEGSNDSYWRRNEITVVITAISFFFPIFFEALGLFESYHPRRQLRMQLARIMALNLLNLYALIIALFDKINTMNKTQIVFRDKIKNSHQRNGLHHALSGAGNVTTTTSTTTQWWVTDSDDNAIDTTELTTSMADAALTTLAMTVTTRLANIETSTVVDWYTDVASPTTEALLETVNGCFRRLVECNSRTTTLPDTTAGTTHNRTALLFAGLLLTTFKPQLLDISTDATETYGGEFESLTNVSTTPAADWWDYEINDSNDDTYVDSTANISSYDRTNSTFSRHIRQVLDTNELNSNSTDISNTENSTDFDTSVTSTEMTQLDTDYLDILMSTTDETLVTETPSDMECFEIICPDVLVTTETPVEREDTTINVINTSERMEQPISTITTTNILNPTETDNTVDPATTQTDTSEYTENPIVFEYTTPNTVVDTTATSDLFAPFHGGDINGTSHYSNEHISLTEDIKRMDASEQLVLRKLCWETMFGQELVKLTVMDLVVTITSTLFMDFFRALFVRFFNKFWCWDLEKRYPKYGDFKIAENILHLVNNQGQVWMGMFFSPGLAILNIVKLVILMYLRSWAVLTCNVPHEVVFRASRSNNFYLALLLMMLFLCVLPVGYAIVWIKPSWHCGPFSKQERIYFIFTSSLRNALPSQLHDPLMYIASPSTIIPILLLLILIIYYLVSLTGALREANQDLRVQLRRERTESRKKMLREPKADVDGIGGTAGNVMDRWRKVLEASSPVSPNSVVGNMGIGGVLSVGGNEGGVQPTEEDELKNIARKELLARIMKKALRKGSNTSDDDSHPGAGGLVGDDETDTEQHESLPHDPPVRPTLLLKRQTSNKQPHQHQQRRSAQDKSLTPKSAVASRGFRSDSIGRAKQSATIKAPALPNKSSGRFQIEKVNEPLNNTVADADECPARVVRERRRSLLRQRNLPDSNNAACAGAPEIACSYEVINEKTASKTVSTVAPTEPEMFRLDSVDPEPLPLPPPPPLPQLDLSDDDNTSYRELVCKDQLNDSVSNIALRASSSNDTSWMNEMDTLAPSPRRRGSSPDYAVIMRQKRSRRDSAQIEPEQLLQDTPSDPKPTEDKPVAKQTKRRFNSFLALVREVVTIKRQESLPESTEPIDSHAVPATSESLKRDLPAEPISSSGRRRESAAGLRQSLRRKSRVHSATRQDSQASIWSENIPVITISKTESDECILEDDRRRATPSNASNRIETVSETRNNLDIQSD